MKEPLKSISFFFRKIRTLPEFGGFIGFLIIFIFFSIVAKEFLSLGNLSAVLTLGSELGIVTIGIALLMISGEFDLSIGSMYAFSAYVVGVLSNRGMPSLYALMLTLGFAVIIGVINGLFTTKFRIPSFITTLGMMLFLRGILYAVTGGSSVSYLGDSFIVITLGQKFQSDGILGYFRPSHFWYIGLLIIFSIILTRTAYGNHVFAVGGKEEAARAMGINVRKIKLINFIICSVLAAFSGAIVLSRLLIISPVVGEGMELEAIAAAVIGGVSLRGGYGTIFGTFFGVILIAMVRNGLLLAGAPPYWYSAFVGIILLIATLLNVKVLKRE
jgi:simple sugar transport system permease protein